MIQFASAATNKRYDELTVLGDWSPAHISAAPTVKRWKVVPVSRHRDSKIFEVCNFLDFCALLGCDIDTEKEIVTVEAGGVWVMRTGHGAYGWVESIIVGPQHADSVGDILDNIDDHPMVNEDSDTMFYLLSNVAESQWQDEGEDEQRAFFRENGEVFVPDCDLWDLPGELSGLYFDKIKDMGF